MEFYLVVLHSAERSEARQFCGCSSAIVARQVSCYNPLSCFNPVTAREDTDDRGREGGREREREREREGWERETEWQECEREKGVREKERDRDERDKDKKRFRMGERKIGRETGVVEGGRQELEREIKR